MACAFNLGQVAMSEEFLRVIDRGLQRTPQSAMNRTTVSLVGAGHTHPNIGIALTDVSLDERDRMDEVEEDITGDAGLGGSSTFPLPSLSTQGIKYASDDCVVEAASPQIRGVGGNF